MCENKSEYKSKCQRALEIEKYNHVISHLDIHLVHLFTLASLEDPGSCRKVQIFDLHLTQHELPSGASDAWGDAGNMNIKQINATSNMRGMVVGAGDEMVLCVSK